MQKTTLKSNPRPLKPDAAGAAAETFETFGAVDETVAAAAIAGEFAPSSTTAAGEDLAARFAPFVVIRNP